jgi:hypothetical protein
VKKLLASLGLLLGAAAGAVGVAEYLWRARTASLVARLREQAAAGPTTAFLAQNLARLPQPVARYLRIVLPPSPRSIRYARFAQQGEFRAQPTPDGWRPFTAVHHASATTPGFVWDARIRMAPGMAVRVRDGFLDDRGMMIASVWGLWPVTSVEGTADIAAGALHRYLAEAVWFPTALLTGRGIVWTAIDDTRARATLTAGTTAVSLDFHFDEEGLVSRVFTPARMREVDGRGVPTPWEGRFGNYAERDGMKVPLVGEVAWLLESGPLPYWRGAMTGVAFEY